MQMKITLTRFTQAFPVPETKAEADTFQTLHERAHDAGMKAGTESSPTPMTVQEADLSGNPIGKTWYVSEGACGFAWIRFKGNTAWGKWAKAQGIATPAYPKGLQIWVSEFNQSVTRKEAYANAYAKVLCGAGIEAYADSRLD
jgi:hypothetical protein